MNKLLCHGAERCCSSSKSQYLSFLNFTITTHLTTLKSALSLIIKSKSLFEIWLHKSCSSPGPSLASLGFHFLRCRDAQSFSLTQAFCLALSAFFFLLSGLLCKSQLAGPWCTGGLTQESYICPILPLLWPQLTRMLCSPASHSSLTMITTTKSSQWQRKHKGKAEMRPKWQG